MLAIARTTTGAMRHILLPILALASACGIHSMKSEMQAWVGRDESEIVSKWGAPTRSATLSDSTRVLTWTTKWNAADDGQPPEMLDCDQTFTVSRAGRVVAWSTRNCPRYYVHR